VNLDLNRKPQGSGGELVGVISIRLFPDWEERPTLRRKIVLLELSRQKKGAGGFLDAGGGQRGVQREKVLPSTPVRASGIVRRAMEAGVGYWPGMHEAKREKTCYRRSLKQHRGDGDCKAWLQFRRVLVYINLITVIIAGARELGSQAKVYGGKRKKITREVFASAIGKNQNSRTPARGGHLTLILKRWRK